jgi:hypothetical protein
MELRHADENEVLSNVSTLRSLESRDRYCKSYNGRMYTTSRLLIPLAFCALLGGCAGVSPTRIIGDTVGAAGGALIGSALSKGNPLIAAAGEALQAGSSSAQQKSYASGYEKGRSDAAKQQFQALINQQRTAPGIDDAANVRLLDVPLPERQVNGVTLAPSTATLRIQE